MNHNNTLSHTTWNCKYHIVFAQKYCRQIIYGKIKVDISQILRKLCEYKGVEIIEANACADHIHMVVSIPPKISVSQFMGYTSTAVKQKYIDKTYSQWSVKLKNEVFKEIEGIKAETGLSLADFLKMLVNEKYGKDL